MANKALAKRQKMAARGKPPLPDSKPRNPYAVLAKQRTAGAHTLSVSAKRQELKRTLIKLLGEPGKDMH